MALTQEEHNRLKEDARQREVFALRVLVVGGGFEYCRMFYDAGIGGATSVEEADFICFTGGADVDPVLYGQEAIPGTHTHTLRDEKETAFYVEALARKKPMVGICRGSQFLNVMNGGKLWQDVNNHAVGAGHIITDLRKGVEISEITSTHHQMMIPTEKAEILALASLATHKKSFIDEIKRDKPELDDVEAVWYPDTLCLCFQPHPEFQYGNTRNYFLELFDEYVMTAC